MQPRRKAEFAAVDLALDHLGEVDAILQHDSNGRPQLARAKWNISISHALDQQSTRHVAVLLSENPCGIDIETFRPQLERVAPRVFTQRERDSINSVQDAWSQQALRCLIWTVKEAAWKAFGPALAFETEIELLEFPNALQMAQGTTCSVRVRNVEHAFFLAVVDGNLGVALGPVSS